MTNIIFFGSSQYSIIILKKLLEIPDFHISTVFTKPDKPIGRSQTITPNPVAQFALNNNLPLLQPETFSDDLISTIDHLKADLGLCVAYGPPYFTQEIIDIPKYKIVNIHPSPLPKYRGATPGPWQIINGETTSAVTFFQIDALPDHGPIITQIPFNIDQNETATTFYDKAFDIAANNLESVLKSYISNLRSEIRDLRSLTPQDHTQKSYFPRFTKESALINWSWPIDKIERFIRALNPWPIAWTKVKNQNNQISTMKIFSAQIESNSLIPLLVRIEGKNTTNWSEIKKYYQIIRL